MDDPIGLNAQGPFDARYVAFLETITTLRPSLHRYCSRMLGSVLDGEDAVQEALFDAYRKLDSFDDSRRLEPWLFRIAHNRCIDLLRRRGVRIEAEAAVVAEVFGNREEPPHVAPEMHGREVDKAVEHLVLALPPKERACVLLKEVFDYSLEEIAELVDSTVGGVKAALSRGRSKLALLPGVPSMPAARQEIGPEASRLLHLYVERFNQRDWDGLRDLIAADARLCVADRYFGSFSDAPYLTRYESMTVPWQMAVGEVDGEPAVIRLQQKNGIWSARSIIRIVMKDQRIVGVIDYSHCPWVFASVNALQVETS
ncbi:MAG TPA: RNA polymerase sigma factor [Candidatus Angelobacter sp.]|nr:RNA polymerase sigma factor [Candidatus Angelobacter sp.]